ncbi:MAG: exonuclease SbcCD subunit D [Anaerovoracaceae bacterium]
MKFIHLSDLHIGKRVNEFNMLEDQKFILEEILATIDEENVNAALIAGDVYDKTVPAVEAVKVFDWFLTELYRRKLEVYMISGNHDSAERLAFGNRLLAEEGIYVSEAFDGEIKSVISKASGGNVQVFMMPYIKPISVRKYFENQEVVTYDTAIKVVMDSLDVDKNKVNIILAHQFVAGAARCESEEIAIGGVDSISLENFNDFDYVALGHLHGPQKLGRDTVRYAGSPLKYSFSEVNHNKSVPLIEVSDSGDVRVTLAPLKPLRDMRVIRGTYDQVMAFDFYKDSNVDDYIKVVLTDEEPIHEVLSKLRSVYPNIMTLEFDNTRTKKSAEVKAFEEIEQETPYNLISKFYEIRNNQEMTEKQSEICNTLIEEIWR